MAALFEIFLKDIKCHTLWDWLEIEVARDLEPPTLRLKQLEDDNDRVVGGKVWFQDGYIEQAYDEDFDRDTQTVVSRPNKWNRLTPTLRVCGRLVHELPPLEGDLFPSYSDVTPDGFALIEIEFRSLHRERLQVVAYRTYARTILMVGDLSCCRR